MCIRDRYEVDKEADSIYEMGVLGSLENGILEPGVHLSLIHISAGTGKNPGIYGSIQKEASAE